MTESKGTHTDGQITFDSHRCVYRVWKVYPNGLEGTRATFLSKTDAEAFVALVVNASDKKVVT